MGLTVLLAMFGGLGLFLYGMRVMSDSIEKVAGAKLRNILEKLTTNRFTGMLVGIIFTGIIHWFVSLNILINKILIINIITQILFNRRIILLESIIISSIIH